MTVDWSTVNIRHVHGNDRITICKYRQTRILVASITIERGIVLRSIEYCVSKIMSKVHVLTSDINVAISINELCRQNQFCDNFMGDLRQQHAKKYRLNLVIYIPNLTSSMQRFVLSMRLGMKWRWHRCYLIWLVIGRWDGYVQRSLSCRSVTLAGKHGNPYTLSCAHAVYRSTRQMFNVRHLTVRLCNYVWCSTYYKFRILVFDASDVERNAFSHTASSVVFIILYRSKISFIHCPIAAPYYERK